MEPKVHAPFTRPLTIITILISHIRINFLEIYTNTFLQGGLFPICLSVKIHKGLLRTPSYLPWSPQSSNSITLIPCRILKKLCKHEVPHCKALFTLHSNPFCLQIFASGSCSQVPLVCFPPATPGYCYPHIQMSEKRYEGSFTPLKVDMLSCHC